MTVSGRPLDQLAAGNSHYVAAIVANGTLIVEVQQSMSGQNFCANPVSDLRAFEESPGIQSLAVLNQQIPVQKRMIVLKNTETNLISVEH